MAILKSNAIPFPLPHKPTAVPRYAIYNDATKMYLNEKQLGISESCKVAKFDIIASAQAAIDAVKRDYVHCRIEVHPSQFVPVDAIHFELRTVNDREGPCYISEEYFQDKDEDWIADRAKFWNEEEAHEARLIYEQIQEFMGRPETVEVVAKDSSDTDLYIS